ncbi:acetylneuraminic acid synthetase, partial [Salmonella enterica]|nr:acetylneuraminic acid synthetase [Salmonella enterica]
SQYALFKRYDKFGEEEYTRLAMECEKQGIDFLSTPFDFDSANYLAPLMKYFKISSSDITNIPFLKYIASFQKPIILSVGAATYSEIMCAVEVINNSGCTDLTLLHCVLSYPTKNEDANLQFIARLKEMFPNQKIGYSDHTMPDERMLILTSAVMLGASIIEKHFTLDKTKPGNDHYHAMDKNDIKVFKDNIQLLNTVIRDDYNRPLECEKESRKYARRSLVTTREIKAGEVIREKDITFKRP